MSKEDKEKERQKEREIEDKLFTNFSETFHKKSLNTQEIRALTFALKWCSKQFKNQGK